MIEYPEEFLELLESVTAKRPRTVIQHILEHGFITSEEKILMDIIIPRVPFEMFGSTEYLLKHIV